MDEDVSFVSKKSNSYVLARYCKMKKDTLFLKQDIPREKKDTLIS
jgi:hypothetical protein